MASPRPVPVGLAHPEAIGMSVDRLVVSGLPSPLRKRAGASLGVMNFPILGFRQEERAKNGRHHGDDDGVPKAVVDITRGRDHGECHRG